MHTKIVKIYTYYLIICQVEISDPIFLEKNLTKKKLNFLLSVFFLDLNTYMEKESFTETSNLKISS